MKNFDRRGLLSSHFNDAAFGRPPAPKPSIRSAFNLAARGRRDDSGLGMKAPDKEYRYERLLKELDLINKLNKEIDRMERQRALEKNIVRPDTQRRERFPVTHEEEPRSLDKSDEPSTIGEFSTATSGIGPTEETTEPVVLKEPRADTRDFIKMMEKAGF